MQTGNTLILIGGSAGSMPVLFQILEGLPAEITSTIVIVLHRQKNVISEFANILTKHAGNKRIIEPEDKQLILPGNIYLAPQNYHLLIEHDFTFSLDYSELVNYSRPSIDVTFESAAQVFKNSITGIVLSGANSDGASGLSTIISQGGKALVQDPASAEYPMMPERALQQNPLATHLSPHKIVRLIAWLNT
ncbi:MAG: chemotaxis protein CheB [Chitinophagaceae bacterium]|nr:chemotaxis protein CheB [Chitinophagaceae bacterium]